MVNLLHHEHVALVDSKRLLHVPQLPDAVFEKLGWEWFLGGGEWNYLTSEMLSVSEAECMAFYEAGNALYDLFIDASNFVITHNLLDVLGIPDNMREIIRLSWEDERHLHLLGRFDFAGGLDGEPIKLLEFNADTPTSIPETAIVQWAQLLANDMSEDRQFNTLYEDLVDQFKKVKALNSDLHPALLLTTMAGYPEDDHNVMVLGQAAEEAGFEVAYEYLEHVFFSPTDGIFKKFGDKDYRKYDFWFKLVPWEYIAEEEPELLITLTELVRFRKAVILNPAYTLLFQSKGIMKFMWDLHPNHPNLLKTTLKPPDFTEKYAYVQKVMLGREGENVTIYDENGLTMDKKAGNYAHYPSVYQEFAKLNKDKQGFYYQPGVFFCEDACGMGFRRRNKLIVDEDAEFLGHLINQ